MFSAAASVFLKVLMSMSQSLLTHQFIEWALLKCAEMYVKSTETTADDEWFEKIKEIIQKGK
jgi:hypothetical protein